MLEVATALAFVAYGLNPADSGNLTLGVVLAIIILLTCTMNYQHDRQTSNVMRSIKSMLPQECTVVRDGKRFKTAAANVCTGGGGGGARATHTRTRAPPLLRAARHRRRGAPDPGQPRAC